jgi:hypothetical protein
MTEEYVPKEFNDANIRAAREFKARAEKMEAALRKIAALIDSEAGEPLDEAIWIANEALR